MVADKLEFLKGARGDHGQDGGLHHLARFFHHHRKQLGSPQGVKPLHSPGYSRTNTRAFLNTCGDESHDKHVHKKVRQKEKT